MESDIDAVFVSFPSTSEEDRSARTEYFVGDLAEWSAVRAKRFGDVVVPKHMYIEWVFGERHNAAWLEHSGRDQNTGELFHLHHIACDCIRIDNPETPEELESSINESLCPVLHNALSERARLIARKFRIHENLLALSNLGADDYHDMALSVIENTLILDQLHPDEWMGNVLSGQHRTSLVSQILDMPVETTQMYTEILELQGKVEVDGDTLRLAA